MRATRRAILAAGGASVMGAGTAVAAPAPFAHAAIEDSLSRYIGFGAKPSGSAADNACGVWMEETLAAAGFRTQRQTYDAPYFAPARATLDVAGRALPLLPQAPVLAATVSGPLAAQTPGHATPRGAIVVARLPFRRWSTSAAPEVQAAVQQAVRDGAAALLLVTEGPTGQAVALNVEADRRWPLPIAVLAPRDAAQIADTLRDAATAAYVMRGEGGLRSAFNVVGALDRGAGRRIVISTPRSAWTIAAGERGGGIAVWRALAAWAPRALPRFDITMLCNSGHEYENLGAARFLHGAAAPPPAQTHLWVHLGASLAARDWHEFGARLLPLPSVDPQRLLVATENAISVCKQSFRGAPGLENVYPASAGAAGELGNILAAGYPRAFGILGAHRFHHVADDDARCVDAGQVLATGLMVRDAIMRLAR